MESENHCSSKQDSIAQEREKARPKEQNKKRGMNRLAEIRVMRTKTTH